MSKLNVGVGADFPVDSAEPRPSDEDRYHDCPYPGSYRHSRRFGRHGRFRGPFFFLGPLALIVFIAMISMAVSYPGVILGLLAVAGLAFALRHHHHWHDDDGPDDRRDGWRGGWRDDRRDDGRRDDGRDRPDRGPQPDAPDSTASGRG